MKIDHYLIIIPPDLNCQLWCSIQWEKLSLLCPLIKSFYKNKNKYVCTNKPSPLNTRDTQHIILSRTPAIAHGLKPNIASTRSISIIVIRPTRYHEFANVAYFHYMQCTIWKVADEIFASLYMVYLQPRVLL